MKITKYKENKCWTSCPINCNCSCTNLPCYSCNCEAITIEVLPMAMTARPVQYGLYTLTPQKGQWSVVKFLPSNGELKFQVVYTWNKKEADIIVERFVHEWAKKGFTVDDEKHVQVFSVHAVIFNWSKKGYDFMAVASDFNCYPCNSIDIPAGGIDNYIPLAERDNAAAAIQESVRRGWKY